MCGQGDGGKVTHLLGRYSPSKLNMGSVSTTAGQQSRPPQAQLTPRTFGASRAAAHPHPCFPLPSSPNSREPGRFVLKVPC